MRHLPQRILARSALPRSVCRSCLLEHRELAGVGKRAYQSGLSIPPTSGIAALPSRRLVSVAGPDAAKFLHGIVTASIVTQDGLPRGDSFYTGFLNATGRILHDAFIYPVAGELVGAAEGPSFLIEVDADQANTFVKHIRRYKLRAKFAIRLLAEGEATVWQAWNDAAQSEWNPSIGGLSISLKDPRAPGMGHRFAQLGQKDPEIDLKRETEDAYTVRRYLLGVPEGQDEMAREHSLPLESNMDVMNGIDYHKGCYVGQELTIRTKHRGVVRKRILPCVIYEKDKAAPLAQAYHAERDSPEALTADMIPKDTSIGRFGKRGRSAGRWLKGVGNVGLGLCRLEIMTDVVLPGETSASAFTPEDEFVLEWGEEDSKNAVKVKAFVPPWLRLGLDQSKR